MTDSTPDNKPAKGQPGYEPSLRDMIMLDVPFSVKVSPSGRRAAVSVRTTNWKDDHYENVCTIHDVEAGTGYPLNRNGSVNQVEWVDDETLALLKQGPGEDDKPQVWLYEGLTGEGWPVTEHKTGVEWFKPFAQGILYRARNPERDENKARADRFGKYTHLEQEESPSALYYVDLEELRRYRARLKASTEDEAKELVAPVVELSKLLDGPLAIRDVIPSPTGDALYINTWPREDLVYMRETSVYCVRLDPRAAVAEYVRREQAKKAEKKEDGDVPTGEGEKEKEDVSYLGQITRLNTPRVSGVGAVSPDGNRLAIMHPGRDEKMFTRIDLWLIDAQAALEAPDADAFLGAMRNISAPLDRELLDGHWVESGIYCTYVDATHFGIVRFQEDGQFTVLDVEGVFPTAECHVSASGRLGLAATNATTFPEGYVADPAGSGATWKARRLTNLGQAVAGWKLGTLETIRWTSRDGTEIEGVLRKPENFDPSRRYPLVFVVHGGPSWIYTDYLLNIEDRAYYPSVQFVNEDVLVLKPNYRGSLGRGQAFAELNVNNLGVGDLWDLESAIDHLAALGWVDRERVGSMGWSQGGYISAFAGLQSTAFKAVSVGAGVSDWYTYHISNDIPDFTVDFLSGSPFRDRERYVKTAPITNLANARTPVLIQHGSDDRRVPLSNAMELYRGLKEMGVPVEVFVFPGMGHPITKPRENHAVMHQNLEWFSHYLLGKELKLE